MPGDFQKIIKSGLIIGGLYASLSYAANHWKESDDIDEDNIYRKEVTLMDPKALVRKTVIYEKRVKPALDQVLSFAGIVMFSPVYAGISIAVYLNDPGPVFFIQKRVGKDKKFFKLHKFRTMYMDAPHEVPTHQLENPQQYITKIGGFLRKTSLDELPQIWDIFRGKMSFIGPRPALWNQDDLVAERDKYGTNDIMPGLTGLAQIKGRDKLEIVDKAKLDGVYTRILQKGGLRAFFFDVRMFVETIMSVICHDGVVEGGTSK